MWDVHVDMGVLGDIRDELAQLINEFDQAEEIAHDEEIGSSTVLDALHEFATNWKVHKKQLVGEMTAVHDIADKAHQSYFQTDEALAGQLHLAPTPIHTGQAS